MFFMPFQVLGLWLRGLLSLLLLSAGIFLLAEWYTHREVVVTGPVEVDTPTPQGERRVQTEQTHTEPWQFGLNRETAFLLGGLALLGWSLGGGSLFSPRLLRRPGADEPHAETVGTVERLRRPDGSELQVECLGPADGIPIVMTHGWGLDRQEWYYARKELGSRYRLILWDLPGLGGSTRPADRDWSLDKLAHDLDAVLSLAGGRPAILLGHSIGGMIILTFCKLFPEALGTRVSGLVLAHTTYTNPVRTTAKAGLYTALQKPVLEPLCHLLVWLSPLVRLMNWLSYVNGSAHRSTEKDSFSGHETRGQLDFITRYYAKAPPDVIGRGMLAMFRYDATDVLDRIPVPTLIVPGDQDSTCTPEASRFMAERIPSARLTSLAPARHCGLFEHHQPFHALIEELVAANWSLSPPATPGSVGTTPTLDPTRK